MSNELLILPTTLQIIGCVDMKIKNLQWYGNQEMNVNTFDSLPTTLQIIDCKTMRKKYQANRIYDIARGLRGSGLPPYVVCQIIDKEFVPE